MNQLKKEYYRTALLTMNQKKTNGKSNKAKPILMLAIINLIDEGHIIGNQIHYDKELVAEYNRIFGKYSDTITLVQYPFYYMRNDGFYSIKGKAEKKTPSGKYIRDNIEYAYLDDGLWELLQDQATRNEFRELIVNYYLKTENE